MALRNHAYEKLAALLEYPTEHPGPAVEACRAELDISYPAAAELLTDLQAYVTGTSLDMMQERYTNTFDLTPVCALEVGFHIFGEDYQRGAFLAHLRESQVEVGLGNDVELPDHLAVLLRWLARITGTEVCHDIIEECILPALAKMDECLADADNPYRNPLLAVTAVLEHDLQSGAARGASEVVTDSVTSQ